MKIFARGKEYESAKEAAEDIGVTVSNIFRAAERGTLHRVGCGMGRRSNGFTIGGQFYENQDAVAVAAGVGKSTVATINANAGIEGLIAMFKHKGLLK